MTAPHNQSQPKADYAQHNAEIVRLTADITVKARILTAQTKEIASLTARCEAMKKALKDIEFFTVDPSSKATARAALNGLARSAGEPS